MTIIVRDNVNAVQTVEKGRKSPFGVKGLKFKKVAAVLTAVSLMLTCVACGNGQGSDDSGAAAEENIEGELSDIMTRIYADLEGIDDERKETMQNYVIDTLTEENEQALLGTADIDYTEGIYSVPMISSIAYQCVLLRVNPEDVEDIKQKLKDNADLNKWICVSAETIEVENTGDLILAVMCDKEGADAVVGAFNRLK